MALKPGREVIMWDVSYFSAATMSRGGVVCAASGVTPGSGESLDQYAQRVQYLNQAAAGVAIGAVGPSGLTPIGLLDNDVVNIDQSVQLLNPYKAEAQIGDKVVLIKKGWVTTNMLMANAATGNNFPVAAYLGPSGLLTTESGYAGSGWPVVGRFLSRRDSDLYAKVQIDL